MPCVVNLIADFGLSISGLKIEYLKSETGLGYVSNWKNAHCGPERGKGLL